jgi:hypothetical protein
VLPREAVRPMRAKRRVAHSARQAVGGTLTGHRPSSVDRRNAPSSTSMGERPSSRRSSLEPTKNTVKSAAAFGLREQGQSSGPSIAASSWPGGGASGSEVAPSEAVACFHHAACSASIRKP